MHETTLARRARKLAELFALIARMRPQEDYYVVSAATTTTRSSGWSVLPSAGRELISLIGLLEALGATLTCELTRDADGGPVYAEIAAVGVDELGAGLRAMRMLDLGQEHVALAEHAALAHPADEVGRVRLTVAALRELLPGARAAAEPTGAGR